MCIRDRRVDVVKTGQDLEMYAILAVVIGGTSLLGGKFSLAGSAVGAVIIAMIRKTIITLEMCIRDRSVPRLAAGSTISSARSSRF